MRLIIPAQLCILLVLPFNAWINLLPVRCNEPFYIFHLQKKHSVPSVVGCKSQWLHLSLTTKKMKLLSRQSCQNLVTLVIQQPTDE